MAKGRPEIPRERLADVQALQYSLNKLHPTHKPIPARMSLIKSFTRKGETVLDPFCGSGSTCAAAALAGRKYIGIEVNGKYHQIATERMGRVSGRTATKPLAYS